MNDIYKLKASKVSGVCIRWKCWENTTKLRRYARKVGRKRLRRMDERDWKNEA